eukprot:scaffold61921_cov69-Phaeocystis_antarctica.AAC.8
MGARVQLTVLLEDSAHLLLVAREGSARPPAALALQVDPALLSNARPPFAQPTEHGIDRNACTRSVQVPGSARIDKVGRRAAKFPCVCRCSRSAPADRSVRIFSLERAHE